MHLSLLGRIALALFGPRPPAGDGDFDPAPVPVPPRAPSAAYGRYLATAIYGCVGCHTDGLEDVEAKLASPNLLAGGLELPDPRGDRVLSTNLTPDPTGHPPVDAGPVRQRADDGDRARRWRDPIPDADPALHRRRRDRGDLSLPAERAAREPPAARSPGGRRH